MKRYTFTLEETQEIKAARKKNRDKNVEKRLAALEMRAEGKQNKEKRDRTADLMTASCYRFVIWSVFASNTSVLSTKSAGFCKTLSAVSTRFRAHLGHNLGQDGQVNLEKFCRSGCGL